MSDKNNTLYFAQKENSNTQPKVDAEKALHNLINVYNARATFFSDPFVKKVKEGNRKALAELLRFPLPPTQMDIRRELAVCLQTEVSEDYIFNMDDGSQYTLQELKRRVPEWSYIAEQALMKSDPKLADKLMSPSQWNAKSAFEVTFVTAMNELKEIRKTKLVSGSFGHYTKWVIDPLKKAMDQVREVSPPPNSLIGYGERITLADAMKLAEKLPYEFQRLFDK